VQHRLWASEVYRQLSDFDDVALVNLYRWNQRFARGLDDLRFDCYPAIAGAA